MLLTRPQDECQALADSLSDVDVFSSVMPLLEIEPLPVDAAMIAQVLDLAHYSAVICVSKPAARLGVDLIDTYWPQPPMQDWFTVGAATASVLSDYGLTVHTSGEGDDSEALLRLEALEKAIEWPQAKVLILRGQGGRELLAERLRERGASVEYLELYRRCLPEYPAGALMRRVEAERLNGLVVSSGQGFEHLHQLAATDWPRLARLPLFVPSPRVAEMARQAGALNVVDCRGASAATLLAALRETPVPAL
nr:uroporphyrinogen-III synthase [Pseudomonas sp. R5(2019)]